MSSQNPLQTGRPTVVERKHSQKLFFNQTEDQYEQSKAALPSYLNHPPTLKQPYSSSSNLFSAQSNNSPDPRMTQSTSKDNLFGKFQPQTKLGSIPSINALGNNIAKHSLSQQNEDEEEFEQDSQEFSLSEISDPNSDYTTLLNIDYRMLALMSVIENQKDEFSCFGILEDDVLEDLGRLRFILMQFHRLTIERCTDEDDEFDLEQYASLINSRSNLSYFLIAEYPMIIDEFDEDYEILRYEEMTEDQYAQEYCWMFDTETITEIKEYTQLMDEIGDEFSYDSFSPKNYKQIFKPFKPLGPGPLDDSIQGTNFFENIQHFRNPDQTGLDKNPKPNPNSKNNTNYQISIRREKPLSSQPDPKTTKNAYSSSKNSHAINFFNLSPISVANKSNAQNESNIKNPAMNLTYQQFVALMSKEKSKNHEEKEADGEDNKKSHFDTILGRKTDQKSEVYLKPFTGEFSKKEDPREKEFMNQVNQPNKFNLINQANSISQVSPLSHTNPLTRDNQSIDQSKNTVSSSAVFQTSNKNELNKCVIGQNQLNSSQSPVYSVNPFIRPSGGINNVVEPNQLKIDKTQSSSNTVPNSQASTSPNLTNVISSSQQERVFMSTPSFSNLSPAEKAVRNPLNLSKQQNNYCQSNTNNSQPSPIKNPFTAPTNTQSTIQTKNQLNNNTSNPNSNSNPNLFQNPFQKNIGNSNEKTVNTFNPFSRNLPKPQSETDQGLKTPQTPKFGGATTAQFGSSQSQNNSYKSFPTIKNPFEASIKQSENFKFTNSPTIVRTQQSFSSFAGPSLVNQTQNSLLPQLSQPAPQQSMGMIGNANNAQAINQNNQVGLQGQNSLTQATGSVSNSFSCIQTNHNPVTPLVATNPPLPVPQPINIHSVSDSNQNPKPDQNINKNGNINNLTESESQMASQKEPDPTHDHSLKNDILKENQIKDQQLNSKHTYSQQQILNMKVSDFISGYCRSEMASIYKDFFEQLLITSNFKSVNLPFNKPINAKIDSLEQSLLENASPYNRYREQSKRTIIRKLRNKKLNQNNGFQHSPFKLMQQVNAKLQKAITFSLTIEAPATQCTSSNYRPDSQQPLGQDSNFFRKISFEHDLRQVQRIQDTVGQQLQKLENKLEKGSFGDNSTETEGQIYLTLNEELVCMINSIRNTQKWLIENDFCSASNEKGCSSSQSKLKVENKLENETEDFQILKTVYKNLNMIETNIESMSQVLSSLE